MSDPAPGTALCFGEALIDEYPDRRVVAGAPLHVAAHLADLGWHAVLVSRVGDDPDGRRIVATAASCGVDTRFVEVDLSLPTGRVTIDLRGGDHSFLIERPAAWDAIAGPDPMPEHDVLLFGTLPLRDGRSRSALQRLLDHSEATVVVDANLRPPDFDEERIRFATGAANVLKASEEEVPVLAEALGVPSTIDGLLSSGPAWVCVTRGSRGASLAHQDGGRWSVPGVEVAVTDTVGAGDAFLAGLVTGLLTGRGGESALEWAVTRATAVVQQRGGLPRCGH